MADRPPPTSRGFIPWRLSDAGPDVYRTVVLGRHLKPFTRAAPHVVA